MKGGDEMTPLLDLIFECILSPNDKVENIKGKVTLAKTGLKTVNNISAKKYNNLQDCYKSAAKEAAEETEEMFKGVKFPW
jgi:hypothetical protein